MGCPHGRSAQRFATHALRTLCSFCFVSLSRCIDHPELVSNGVGQLFWEIISFGHRGGQRLADITQSRIQKIRKTLGMSQDDFARVLWVTYSTLSRWERGYASPFGLHLHILRRLENLLGCPAFKRALKDPRADDPLFLLYHLLKPLYETRIRVKP
jgi:transcriptional regulator with XRE-family HTH domain